MAVEPMSDADLLGVRAMADAFSTKLSAEQFSSLISRLDAAERECEVLREAAIALRDDMLQRAQMDAWSRNGAIVVEAGAGVWSRFNAALTANHSAPVVGD